MELPPLSRKPPWNMRLAVIECLASHECLCRGHSQHCIETLDYIGECFAVTSCGCRIVRCLEAVRESLAKTVSGHDQTFAHVADAERGREVEVCEGDRRPSDIRLARLLRVRHDGKRCDSEQPSEPDRANHAACD